jgi:hypothetical protein
MTQKQALRTVLALAVVLLLARGAAAGEKNAVKIAKPTPAEIDQKVVKELVEIVSATDSPDTFALAVLALQQLGDKAKPAVPTIIRNAERLKIFSGNAPTSAYVVPSKKQQLANAVAQGILQMVNCNNVANGGGYPRWVVPVSGVPVAQPVPTQSMSPPTVSASYYTPVSTLVPKTATAIDQQLVKELVEIMTATDSLTTFALSVTALERVGEEAKSAVPSIIRNAERLKVFTGTSTAPTPNGLPTKKQQVATAVAQAVVSLLQPGANAPRACCVPQAVVPVPPAQYVPTPGLPAMPPAPLSAPVAPR